MKARRPPPGPTSHYGHGRLLAEPLTDEQMDRIWDFPAQTYPQFRAKAFLALCSIIPLRRNHIARVVVSQIDLEARLIVHDQRPYTIPPEAHAALSDYLARRIAQVGVEVVLTTSAGRPPSYITLENDVRGLGLGFTQIVARIYNRHRHLKPYFRPHLFAPKNKKGG